MKKWKEYTPPEKRMLITLIVLVVAVLLSWGRVSESLKKYLGNRNVSPTETTP
ncbi:MAG: hypothetical protein LBR65_09800 [Culturomica sp.]|jgi:cell division protein FtsL|nr:hypothetical protein [Culturomica sp.]